MIDFPANPTIGQVFTANAMSWMWDGVKWTVAAGTAGAYVLRTGDTMSGDLTINAPDDQGLTVNGPNNDWAGVILNAKAGQGNWIEGTVNGHERWEIDLGNAVNESGSNSGSNFQIARYSDAGNFIDDPIIINRQSGLTFLNAPPAVDNSAAAPTTAWVQSLLAGRQNRNRLINGSFLVDQWWNRANITPTNGQFVCDHWRAFLNQAGKFTSQCLAWNSTAFPAGVGGALQFVSTSAFTSAATDSFGVAQPVEFPNVADLAWGKAGAATVTLSFIAMASVAGTYSGAIVNAGSTRAYPFSFALPANVWTPVVITIPGDTTGTWYTAPNAASLMVRFDLGAGANLRASANAWTNGNIAGVTGAASLVATNGAAITFANVQLELGAQATPFDQRSYGHEFVLCQRYYQIGGGIGGGGVWFGGGNVVSGGNYFANLMFPMPMRATPTVTLSAGGGSGFPAVAGTASNMTYQGFTEGRAASATATAGAWFSSNWAANAEI